MQNKVVAKQVLNAVQSIVSGTKGKVLDQNLLKNLQNHILVITDFFEVDEFQAVVLSLYLEYGFRNRDLDNERIVDHFGRDLSAIADVSVAISELNLKKFLVHDTSSYNFKKGVQNEMKVHYKAIQAMIEGDNSILKAQKASTFIDLLSLAEDLIKQRIGRTISTKTLNTEIMALLESNKHFAEVDWLLTFKNKLESCDYTLLLDVCIEQLEGENVVDFDKNINEVFEDMSTRIKYKRSIKEERCPLFKHNFIEFADSFLNQMNFVQLTPDTFEMLLGGNADNSQRVVKPTMGILISPDSIEEETLFYNTEEEEQIKTLFNAFEEENFQNLVTNMKANKMKAGFTVLLHGHPGTGKTASVKQMAKATGRSIFLVEIEKVHSKWVGESEKNVAKIFQEYQRCKKVLDKTPILLFNEADAILGKRISVKSSVDQMNNSMQNLLLQNLEDFEGIFIATSNLADQLDSAFDRRLLYKVKFAKPTQSIREQILREAFSELSNETINSINGNYLLTGGQIHNIKKKLLVKSILFGKKCLDNEILELCKAEFSLSSPQRSEIGFRSMNQNEAA